MMNRIIKTIIYILFINYSIASDFNTTNTSLKWEEVSTELYNDEKLKCSDGSDYKFYFKKGSENLLIFFSGGGACWDYDTCNSHNKSYPIKTYENKTDLKYNKPGHWKGLLDLDNSNNPIKDWSILFLPYCSADLHIGNKIKYYSKENRKIKIYHNGYNNINFALNWMKKNKIDSFNKTIVSGSSSGGYGAMFNFSLIKKKINSKSFIVVSDAADGVISKDFTENVFIKSSTPWNATISLEKTTNKNNSIIDYFDHIIKQNKDTKFLSFSSDWDVMQILFFNIMSKDTENWLDINKEVKMQWNFIANQHKKRLLKNDNYFLKNYNGCIHSGLSYDDVFYNKNNSINEWLNSFNEVNDKQKLPSEKEFLNCFNRAIFSVKE